MARYFGGFRDRLLKKGRSSPLSDRDVDWIKVSGTVIWSPEKRDYAWVDPGNYLTSFLNDGEGPFRTPEPTADASPAKKKDKPVWDLGALANEPDAEDSYTPPSGLFSSGGMAIPQPDIEAELPGIDEYKNELLSALRRRGLRVDVRKISLPEDVEQDLTQFHQGDKSIDSHALRARLQVFKRQVIDSFDQFSRVGETYIIPHAPRYPGFEPEEPAPEDILLPETIESEDLYLEEVDGPIDFASDTPVAPLEQDVEAALSEDAEIDGIDSDYESFVLKSLDKLEASMGGGSERMPEESQKERSSAPDNGEIAGDSERPPGSRRIYDPLNGTLDIPRKSSEPGPRLRPAPGADAPVDAPGPPRFSATPHDGTPPRESWIVSPVQSRKSDELDRSVPATPDVGGQPAAEDKPKELARPKKPDVLKAFHTLRAAPSDSEPPAKQTSPTAPASEADHVADARQQALSILARLDPPTGDGHAMPSDLAPSGESPNPRPDFPALESIAAAIEDERRSVDPPTPASNRPQSLSDFLLSLKNEHEESHVTSSKTTQPAPAESLPQKSAEDASAVSKKPATPSDEVRFPRPVEEKKRTVALFAKPERRAAPRSEAPAAGGLNVDSLHVEALNAEPVSDEAVNVETTNVEPVRDESLNVGPLNREEAKAEARPLVAGAIQPPLAVQLPEQQSVALPPMEKNPVKTASAERLPVEEPPARTRAGTPFITERPVVEDRMIELPAAPAPRDDEEAPASDAFLDASWLRGVSAAFLSAGDEEVQPPEEASGHPLPEAPEPTLPEAPVLASQMLTPPQVLPVLEPPVEESSASEQPTTPALRAGESPVFEQPSRTAESEWPPARPEVVDLASIDTRGSREEDMPHGVAQPHEGLYERGVLETPDPAHVLSEQPTPVSIPEARPAVPDHSEAPSRTMQNFMAEHMAVPEDTDQRHAEKLTRSAREALEALESREAGDEVPPPVTRPVVQPLVRSEPPAVSAYEAKLDGVVEALAFAADDPIPLARVSKVFSEISGERRPTEAQVAESVERLNTLYGQLNRAFRVKIWAGGIRMATDPGYAEYVRAIYKQDRPKKLSRTLMETLAIVAYSQPTTKPEVDFIRGVDSDYAVRKLLEMGLLDIVGRSDAIGKPLLYGTSDRFLEQFGLSELAALPKLKEIEELLDDPSLQRERMHLMALESGLDGARGDSESSEVDEG